MERQSKMLAQRLARVLSSEELDAIAGGSGVSTLLNNTGPYGGGQGQDSDVVGDGGYHW